ncbi:hypothetical protein PG1C_01415 [Rugosibacter aromaticivorans]|uniref:Fe-S oxidoreductase n=1 Tax=Rugosibacter aromaticivorans TaxID=1565605 RepID=A0A0C5J665_9PROT|nr:DUF1289 domain-containing protein [Rugosibacter aromaticivorans]AJP47480.1 hypothetical protein PG1C_01415 [Rugosibacter aromaticivorans]TBR13043.1 MAG: DUF1289 domain-containing protein [Rugosibacter sp.]
MTAINSPCVNVCRMQGTLCLGCYRTLNEIAGWSQMSDAGKQQVLSAVAKRSVSVAENSDVLPAAQKKSG